MNGQPRLERPRFAALDLARGFAIVGMFAVNASTAIFYRFPDAQVYSTLRHAEWVGCTTADFVFPLFLFFMGVSLAVSTTGARTKGVPWLRVTRRVALLIVLGLLINSISLLGDPGGTLRLEGTLQRIGLVYLLAIPITYHASPRARIGISVGLLLGYAAMLCTLPFPGIGEADLGIRNLNFSAWLDLQIFGDAALAPGPDGIPMNAPPSLLSLGSSVVLTLLGTVVGDWLVGPEAEVRRQPWILATAGIALLSIGGAWATFHPLIKLLWTSSFILYTSGAALSVLALCLVVDRQMPRLRRALWPIEAFGRNALTAYLVHVPAVALMSALGGSYAALSASLSPKLASLPFIAIALGLTFIPIAWMAHRDRFFRL